MRTNLIAGLVVAAAMADRMREESERKAIPPPPEPSKVEISQAEQALLELTKARAAMIREQGPETRQQRRHRNRREAKAVASFMKQQQRKLYK